MPVFAVQYTYNDRAADRDIHRPEHRAFLRELLEKGQVLATGPYTDDEAAGALLIFRTETVEALGDILAADPFAIQGLVEHAQVRTWNPVMGPFDTYAE